MKPGRNISIPAYISSKQVPILALIVTAVLASAVGLLGGLLLSAETVAGHSNKPAVRLKIVVLEDKPPEPQYTVLSSHVWSKTEWGQNCSVAGRPASTGLGLLCKLPAIWKDCSGGIYLDVVSENLGKQHTSPAMGALSCVCWASLAAHWDKDLADQLAAGESLITGSSDSSTRKKGG
jgi:hypothetical protein